MVNIYEILLRAASLKEETTLNSISPERAGGIMYDTLLALNDLWLQQGSALVISKIYASVAAMEADTAPVSDLTGKPLRPGQIVVIASSDSDNGSVYRYNGTDAPSWSLVGAIGSIPPVDSLDSDSTTLPLAAHQGKVLDGKISQLGQIATAGESDLLKGYLTKRDGCYNATTHRWEDLLKDYGFLTYFGVAVPGASLTISTGAKGTIIYLLKSLPIDYQDVNFAGTESDSLIEIQANTTQDIVIPAATAYYGIIENVLASENYEFPQSITISKSGAEILDWKIKEKGEFKNFSLIESGSELPNLDNFENGLFTLTSGGTITNLPSDVNFGDGCLLFVIRGENDSLSDWDRQILISVNSPGYIYNRVYVDGQWQGWVKFTIKQDIIQWGLIYDASINYDNLVGGIYGFTAENGKNIGLPTDLLFGDGGILFVFRQSDTSFSDWDRQVLKANGQPGIVYTRVRSRGVWQQWVKRESSGATNLIECGVGKEYTTLRSAVAAAIQTKGTKVIVYPGTYDLTQEFATELANHSGSGILLTNDVHVIFMPGAYVTCMVDVSNEWAYTNFEPFRVDGGNFTLENANINCKNTRYNVHDELNGGNAQYIHRYINCIMEHLDENPIAYYTQCIGGGLGTNGYIEVIGGKYKSTSLYYQTEHYSSPDDMQMPITYHNGYNAACDCKIVIKDVYLVDKGYLRFGNYGPSAILTPVFVSGCRMYKPVFLMNETWSPSQVQNFEVFSFNNEVVNP